MVRVLNSTKLVLNSEVDQQLAILDIIHLPDRFRQKEYRRPWYQHSYIKR